MATSFTKETKPSTQYTKQSSIDFLLKQDSDYLLLESGFKIVLRRGYAGPDYTKETKPSTTFSAEAKP